MHKLMQTENKRQKKRLRKIMAMLLSAALILGTVQGAVPVNVMAQEHTGEGYIEASENISEPAEEIMEEEPVNEETRNEEPVKAETDNKDAEETVTREQDTAIVSEYEPSQEPQEQVSEEEVSENAGENNAQLKAASDASARSGNIYSGTDWNLGETDKKLVIESDAGMADWCIAKTSRVESFYEDKITSVEIKDGVSYIGEEAFFWCQNMTSVTIPSSVTSIESEAFELCTGLPQITIPNSVINIEARAFYACRQLTEITIPNITNIKASTFGSCKGLKTITIPNSVTSIGEGAFSHCSGAETITIPNSVTSIGEGAFSYCSGVETITIPNSVTSMGDGVLMGCDALKDVKLPNDITSIGKETFSQCINLTSITIPDSVTSIGEMAFAFCSSLESITLPDKMTDIGRAAFAMCTKLTSITIPDSVTSIGAIAFAYCSSLESIKMEPDTPPQLGLDEDDVGVFTECKFVTDNVKGIKVPVGFENAYKTAWTDWADFIIANIASGKGWTLDSEGTLTLESEDGIEDWCKDRKNGREIYKNDVTSAKILDGVVNVKAVLWGAKNVKSVELPDSVKSIGNLAFSRCQSLTDITIPEGVTSIGEEAFYECRSLPGINLPSGLTNIGRYAFSYCYGLTDIDIPVGATGGDWVFSHCIGLTHVTIPDGMTEIWGGMFSGCTELTAIEIPDSVTKIGDWAFSECSGLTEITIPSGVTKIGDWAFSECSGLTSINIPSDVTEIGGGAFSECSGLTDITIPSGVERIEAMTFVGCSKLKHITIPDNVTSIGYYAFYMCSALENIIIPSGVTEIGCSTFAECTNLDSISIRASTPPSLEVVEGEPLLFENCKFVTENTQGIHVPDGAAQAYKTAWTDWADYIADDSPQFSDAEKVAAAKEAVEKALEDITVSNATTKESIQTAINDAVKAALEEAGIDGSGISITVEDFAKTDATTNAAGSVTGKVTITSGTESAETAIDKTITKLELTDAEKVAAVKEAVEKALEDITVSNATTKESIQTAINDAVKAALEEAGIDGSGISITVEDFAKTDATTNAAGSVTGKVTITSGTESAETAIDKTITKLPTTPADKVETVRAAVQDALKKAVEEALEGTKVTNDNAQDIANQIAEEIIPAAVAKALEETGVSPKDIAIGEVDIKVSPSDADSEGSIDVVIPITSTEDSAQTGNAQIQVPIEKTGGEQDPDMDAEQAENTIKDTLGKLEITNDTTTDDIHGAIQEAFGDDAVIGDIEVVEKTEATEENPGSLGLKINVTINGKTIIINIVVPIKKTGSRTGVYVRFTDYYKLDENDQPCYKYTGTAIKPAVEVYHNETLLALGTDYTISYKNNTKVSSAAALTVKGKGNFTGTSNMVNFTIINADIAADTKHPTKMTVVANTKIAPVILNVTKKLTAKDYMLTGEGLDGKGKYTDVTADGVFNTLTVKGIGSYEGSSFDIQVKVIDKSAAKKFTVTVDRNFQPVYDAKAINLTSLFQSADNQNGVIAVTDSADPSKLLREGEDFTTVCISNLTNAGTVQFMLTGMGEYTGTVNKTFKINPLKVSDSSKFAVTFDENKVYEYKASGTTVDNLSVKYLGETDAQTDDCILRQGVDYKVSYSSNKTVSDAKDAELKITFLGNYKGSTAVTKTFKIKAAKLSAQNTEVIVPDKVYAKADKAYKSAPIVSVDGVTIKASNYDVSYRWATASKAANDADYVSDDKVKITIAEGDSYAKVKVTITPKGSYTLAEGAVIEGEYYVRKADGAADLSKAKITFHDKTGNKLKNLEYNGAAFYTPEGNTPDAQNAPDDENAVYVRVSVKNKLIDPSLYDVIWTNAASKGKATVVIRGKGTAASHGNDIAVGSKNQSISIKAMAFKGRSLKTYMEKAVENLKKMLF